MFAFCIDDNCENHGTCASQSGGQARGQLRRLASKGRCAATNYDFGVCRKSQHVEKGTRILFCKRLCATLLLLGFRAKKVASRRRNTLKLTCYEDGFFDDVNGTRMNRRTEHTLSLSLALHTFLTFTHPSKLRSLQPPFLLLGRCSHSSDTPTPNGGGGSPQQLRSAVDRPTDRSLLRSSSPLPPSSLAADDGRTDAGYCARCGGADAAVASERGAAAAATGRVEEASSGRQGGKTLKRATLSVIAALSRNGMTTRVAFLTVIN